MTISFTTPLARAWSRMKMMLFSPFDATKWFVVGFTAWLASLTDSTSYLGNGGSKANVDVDDIRSCDWGDMATDAATSVREFFTYGFELALVMLIVAAAIIGYVVILWLSSRGVFMFLDNVVHNRAEVKAPWRQYGRLADSLFIWRLVFGIICLLAIGPIIALFLTISLPMILHESGAVVSIPAMILAIALCCALGIIAIYIDFFTLHFVAPIMYRHDLKAVEAWRRFLPLLRAHVGHFVLYGLFFLLLWICVAVAVMLFGLMTCCIGWLLLAIPYIGAVVMLPIYITFRSLDLEFLGQFGPEYAVLGEATGD